MTNIIDYDLAFSLGFGCGCTQALRRAQMQYASYPFDWIGSPGVLQSAKMLANDFQGWLDKPAMKLVDVRRGSGTINRAYVNRNTGFVFAHDFHHDFDLEDGFDVVCQKYQRRVSRLISQLAMSNKVLAVYVEHPVRNPSPESVIKEAYDVISAKFPQVRFDLLYFYHDDGAPINLTGNHLTANIVSVPCRIKQLEYGLVSHTIDKDPIVRYLCQHVHVDDYRSDADKKQFGEHMKSVERSRYGEGCLLTRWMVKYQYRLHRKLENALKAKGLLPREHPFWF